MSRTRTFRFRGRTAKIPTAVLKRWDGQTQIEILEALSAVYAEQVEKWKHADQFPTLKAIRAISTFNVRRGENVTETWSRLNNRNVKEEVLRLLQYARFRDWHRSPINNLFARAVGFAAMDGDADFFKRLGRRLEERAVIFRPPKQTPLAKLLLEHWVSKKGICLCWFSDRGLTEFLALVQGSFTEDAVRKTRERLKLPKLRRPLIRAVRRDGDCLICA